MFSPPLSLPPSFTRRQIFQIQSSDVIITNMTNNNGGQLEFVLYVQVEGGSRVLAAGVLEAAVEVRGREREERREGKEGGKKGERREKGSREKSERRGVE